MVISQREARRLKRRVYDLEQMENARRGTWANDYPGGVHLRSSELEPIAVAMIKTARKLQHAVVVIETGNGSVNFYALPLVPEVPHV